MAKDDSIARSVQRSDRTLETVSQASRITQELRRRPVTAPRISQSPSGQLDGHLDRARDAIETRIGAHLGGRLSVMVTDNRYTMISVKREKGPAYQVRLHRMFLDAPAPITRALARYIADNDARASRELGRYIESNHGAISIAGRRPKTVILRPQGRVHDLTDIYAAVNARYFAGAVDARITWGPEPATTGRRRRRSIKMGSYAVEDRLIRIHPSLDRTQVPRFFVEWIVFHEMLHQVHPIHVVGGRRQFHTPAFMEDEASFDQYAEARRWERSNIDLLLDY